MKKTITFFILSTIASFTAKGQEGLCLEAAGYVAGSYPNAVITADFNNDGFLDLASTSINTIYNSVVILLGTNTGTFTGLTGNSYFPVGAQPLYLTAADFNKDGNLDIATNNSTGNSITILNGDGQGYFTPSNTILLAGIGQYPKGITSADFNNDGNMDLASGSGNNKIAVFLGTGTGTFGEATLFTADEGVYFVTSADLDGNGATELITANYLANSISVFPGFGSGNFAPAITMPVGTSPRGITCADINGDSLKDILVANSGSGNISVFLGVGGGNFADAATYNCGAQPTSITTGDFNQDGISDLAVANNTGGAESAVSILLGSGNGTFGSPVSFAAGSSAATVLTADFDGNGKPDIASSNYNEGNNGEKNITVLLSCDALSTEKFPGNKLTIYPNPAGDRVTVSLAGKTLEGESTLTIYNMLGKAVYTAAAQAGGTSVIDTSAYPAGIYLLSLKTEKETFTEKLIRK